MKKYKFSFIPKKGFSEKNFEVFSGYLKMKYDFDVRDKMEDFETLNRGEKEGPGTGEFGIPLFMWNPGMHEDQRSKNIREMIREIIDSGVFDLKSITSFTSTQKAHKLLYELYLEQYPLYKFSPEVLEIPYLEEIMGLDLFEDMKCSILKYNKEIGDPDSLRSVRVRYSGYLPPKYISVHS